MEHQKDKTMSQTEKEEIKENINKSTARQIEASFLFFLWLKLCPEINQHLVSAAENHFIEGFSILAEAIENM